MIKIGKIIIVAALIIAIGAVIAFKQNSKDDLGTMVAKEPANSAPGARTPEAEVVQINKSKVLPRLVDLGADKCIPCKMMAPILEELKKEYAGTFDVEFIDVWKNPDAGKKYGIRMIPTQVFFDAAGKELFRHEGFFSREDILAKWKELGMNVEKIQG